MSVTGRSQSGVRIVLKVGVKSRVGIVLKLESGGIRGGLHVCF